MPSFTATAPGKIILFGEHAVVYGRPAVAAPVTQVKARAVLAANPRGEPGALHIQAPDVQIDAFLNELPEEHPLAAAARSVLSELKIDRPPACTLRLTSTIPIAAGMGSGAAVTVAILRAFSAFLGHPLPNDRICALAFEVEKLYHGTPSGIDNTVVTYEMPVYFVKGQPVEILRLPQAITLVIGDTGVASPTAAAVGDVRKSRQARKAHYEALFDSAGAIADSARQMIEAGMIETLGPLMDASHGILSRMGVSSPELDRLVAAARKAGALGAKLSGAGRGGNMIALVTSKTAPTVARALQEAGAVRTIITKVGPAED